MVLFSTTCKIETRLVFEDLWSNRQRIVVSKVAKKFIDNFSFLSNTS